MEIVYMLYAILALVGLAFNVMVLVLRLRRRPSNKLRGISEEHHSYLIINDIILASTSLVILLSMLQDIFKDNEPLCSAMGFADLFVALILSWTPLMAVIILFEKERYCLRMKSYQGMTTRIVVFIMGAIIVIAGALVAINYAPIVEVDTERDLLCVPITFPNRVGSEYTKLLLAVVWCGLLVTWGCVVAWLVYLMRNRRSVRYVTECPRSTKRSGLQVVICLALWTVTMTLLTTYYWLPMEDLLLAAILFSLLRVIGHPCLSLLIQWLGDHDNEWSTGLSRDIPSRLTDVAPLSDKNCAKFRCTWMGKFNEKVQAVIRVYNPTQRRKWLRETQAMALLRKTEHPNIVKYFWVSRGDSLNFPKGDLTKEHVEVLANPDNRMLCTEYYEHGSLRDLLLKKSDIVTDNTLKYIALDIVQGLAHLRELHIAHNNLNSKAIFIKTTPKTKALMAVIGGFEESECVTLDHVRGQRDSIATMSNKQQAADQLNNKFATDIRSYALLLLELVSAWNKHNGRMLKPKASKKRSKSTEVTCMQPQVSVKANQKKSRTLPKCRTLSQKPTFREIEEEPQSKLQQQREVNGEAIAIEMDGVDDPMDLTQGERNYELSQPLALGVIIPSELKDSCLPEYKRFPNHPNHHSVLRQSSSSTCSTDSGYPKSLQSTALPYMFGDFTSSIPHNGKSTAHFQNGMLSAHINDAFSRMDEHIMVGSVHLPHPTINNNVVKVGPEELKGYMKAKSSLPTDVLADYEEYNILEDSKLHDAERFEKETERAQQKSKTFPTERALEADAASDTKTNLNLSELAEKVTHDLDEFLKGHSRSNSNSSSTLPSSIKSPRQNRRTQPYDTASQASDMSDLTFSSAVEQPLHLRLDRELYLDQIISQQHHVNLATSSSQRFLYRPGITKAQLDYSKDLSVMYDTVTPQLLYLSETATKECFGEYRLNMEAATMKQLLETSEMCWLENPVQPAGRILSHLHSVLMAPQFTA